MLDILKLFENDAWMVVDQIIIYDSNAIVFG